MDMHVDFSKQLGVVRPMHSVNNGPVYKFAADQRVTNLADYQAAGIPYARTHDASFCSTYGGEHIVDVPFIFPDFSRDASDPDAYDFALTDDYLKIIELGGAKVFFRLGSKIEHWRKKYNTLPPPDFRKWAAVCEHIIRHYTEGWADGFHMDIEYWEIWNEPDLDADDSEHKRCWGGTKKQFFELYDIAATHLKACFPHLKIGGPALAHNMAWAEDFLAQLKAPLDFFSWHIYAADPARVAEKAREMRALLDRHGFAGAESILNEWNYVRGWTGDDWLYSLKAEKSLRGAAFTAAAMIDCQHAPLDHLMYYDARPGGMNGLFCTDRICERLKGYYPFPMFNTLYRLGREVETHGASDGMHLMAAGDAHRGAAMLVHYQQEDDSPAQTVTLRFTGLDPACETAITVRLLDETHDLDEIQRFSVTGAAASVTLRLPPLACVLAEVEAGKAGS